MPLTSKGKEILSNMEETYKSPEKAKEVFYASANKGTIKGVHNDRRDAMSDDGEPYVNIQRTRPEAGGIGVSNPGTKSPPPPKPPSKDQTQPDPASGPMSTKGPSAGKSEGLPEAATPSSKPAADCAMSLDAIKSMGKRIGRY